MEKKIQIRKAFFETTAMAFVLLFCYAATSKLTDFQNFQVQLAQSPMLSAFSKLLSFSVPAVEFLIVALLFIPRFKRIALLMAFTLMVMFTSYIYIILNYSSFVPCSCGGVLEKMTWSQHMLFNIAFVIAAAAAIIFAPSQIAKLKQS